MNRHEPWDVAELRALTEREIYAMITLDGNGPWHFERGPFAIDVTDDGLTITALVLRLADDTQRIAMSWSHFNRGQAQSDLRAVERRIERGQLE